jgi:hypothetical protein
MTGSSSKLLQIQGKWYWERKPKKYPKPEAKNAKNYSTPISSSPKQRGFVPTAGISMLNGKPWKTNV